MPIYKRKKVWYFKFTIKGKTYHRSIPEATSQREAEKAEAVVKSDLLHGKYDLLNNKGEMSFSELSKGYEQYTKTNNKAWRSHMASLNNHLLPYFKDKKIGEISPFMVEGYRSKRKKCLTVRGTPVSNTTINREIEVLRKMFNIAIDNEWLDKNPASSKKVKKLPEENYRERFLSHEEEVRLLEACVGDRAYLKPIIICALNTGMRKGEILDLKWSNVDLVKGYIHLLETKSGKARKVPISSKLKLILTKLQVNSSSEWVFANPDTNKRFYDLKRGFPAVIKQANINDFKFHDLRHTAATRMVHACIDLVVVKEILGHASIETTMRYAHAVPERKLQAVEALADY